MGEYIMEFSKNAFYTSMQEKKRREGVGERGRRWVDIMWSERYHTLQKLHPYKQI